jgi:serine O-acetyltransferase
MRAAIDHRYETEVAQMHARSDFDGAPSLWRAVANEARQLVDEEPILGSFYHATILNHETLGAALSFHLANKLDSSVLPAMLIREVITEAITDDPTILKGAEIDIIATRNRDPACENFSTPFLYYKGFHALQAYRVAHWLWGQDRRPLALFLQSQVSVTFGIDIHPAAEIGSGIMLDHATGIVIGETSVVEDDVSILHEVTLGGTGKKSGDRHPKIRKGVLLAAGAKIIGNIEVGQGAKVGAGSVVLEDVPAHCTVAGVPAKIVGRPGCESPALDMDHSLES